MAIASSLIIQRQISNVIKRFHFGELESAVLPIFPELSWNSVRSKLIKNHKNFTITNAARVIEEAIENADIRQNDLLDRLAMLEVTDISRHNTRTIWYGYELKDPVKPMINLGKRDIEENMTKEFDSNGFNMNVKVITYNNITFVHIKEKKKQKLQRIVPIFFALFLGQKYFFCSKKNISHDFIKVVTIFSGYKNSKKLKLMGKDLKSLIRILWLKRQGVLHAEDLNQSLVYKSSDPIIRNIGIDYTQDKQRKEYMEQCFGEDPPTLELLAINGPHESVQHSDLASILPTDKIYMNWEFHSSNIAKFLINLTEKHVITSPLPHYVSNFMMTGKNELTLKN